MLSGCATLTRPESKRIGRESHPIIAFRYDVESSSTKSDSTSIEKMRSDFALARNAGLDSVIMPCTNERRRNEAMEIAHRNNLRVFLLRDDVESYLSTGTLPADCNGNVSRLAAKIAREIRKGSSTGGLWIGATGNTAAHDRRRELCSEIAKLGLLCVCEGDASSVPVCSSLALVRTRIRANDAPEAGPEIWLASYHAGLMAGNTGGVLLDQYPIRMSQSEQTSNDGAMSRRASSAIREVITRAGAWGSMLHGSIVTPAKLGSGRPDQIKAAWFYAERRRYLMLFNSSTSLFARREYSVPTPGDGKPVNRIVEIPSSPDQPVGRVIKPRSSSFRVPIDLKPGDAVLFEAFE